MYYTHPFAYNTPVPEAFTTMRIYTVPLHIKESKAPQGSFTTTRIYTVLLPLINGITDYLKALTSPRMKEV